MSWTYSGKIPFSTNCDFVKKNRFSGSQNQIFALMTIILNSKVYDDTVRLHNKNGDVFKIGVREIYWKRVFGHNSLIFIRFWQPSCAKLSDDRAGSNAVKIKIIAHKIKDIEFWIALRGGGGTSRKYTKCLNISRFSRAIKNKT